MKAIYVDFEVWLQQKFRDECSRIPKIELVETFQTASDALEYLRENTVDIVFLDMELPDLDSFTLAEMIRAADPGVVIIYFSAFGCDTQRYMDRHSAKDAVVLKPYNQRDLESALAAACCY